MKPGSGKNQQQLDTERIGVIRDLFTMKFNLMYGRFNELRIDSVRCEAVKGVEDNGFNLFGIGGFDVF